MKENSVTSITEGRPLESEIQLALESAPQPCIPADFAARVAAKAATLPRRAAPPQAHYGRAVSMLMAALLAVSLFIVAPHATPSFLNVGFDVELAFLAQLCALAYWLARSARENR